MHRRRQKARMKLQKRYKVKATATEYYMIIG